jgi:fatty-acyl-CoA synthase
MLNGPTYLEATLGCAKARAAQFNVNYRYVKGELTYLLRDAVPKAIVYHGCFAAQLAEVLSELSVQPLLLQVADGSDAPLLPGAVDYDAALAAAEPNRPATDPQPEDLSIVYTGGTTGMPKGTLWTQGDLWASSIGATLPHLPDTGPLEDYAKAIVDAPELRLTPLPPFMHAASHWAALACMLSGGTVVLPSVVDHLDPRDVWETAQREAVMAISMVGDAFARVLADELEQRPYDLPALMILLSGGAALSERSKARFSALLPTVVIKDNAGSSEAGAHLSSTTGAGLPITSGLFLGDPDTLVLDADRTRVLEPGHEGMGWLARKGPIPLGYLGDAAKSAATVPVIDGVRVAIPGDRARLLEGGLIELLGRDAVTINSGGEKIFAEEVEEAMRCHPGVEDVVVVGRPSERWGQEVVAVVQVAPTSDADDAALVAAASERLARYKLPKAVVRVEKVLRAPSGKADYAWAREQAQSAGASAARS